MRTLFKVEINAWYVFRHSSCTLVKLFVKARDSFIDWICGKLSHIFSSATFHWKLLWVADESFKIASYGAPQTRYLHSIQIWRVIRWLLFLFKHLWAVLVEDYCWETRAMRAEPRVSCWICQQPIALFNELWEHEINKELQLSLLFTTTLMLTLRHSDVIVERSWH